MDPVLVFAAKVPGVSEKSSKEILVDVAVFIEHLVEEKYIVVVEGDQMVLDHAMGPIVQMERAVP